MREGEYGAGAIEQGSRLTATEAKREKTWDECGIEERVARLRQHAQETRAWLEMVSQQTQQVAPHQHGMRGEVLVEQHYGGGMAGSRFDPLA